MKIHPNRGVRPAADGASSPSRPAALDPLAEQSPQLTAAPRPPEPSALRGWIARRLLGWFIQNQRWLPWRRDRDPYHIWVSEVMLQQTQVATVIPYFERFLQAFPTLSALAAADEQEVLRLWEGLGYYRRARDLHRAARHLAAAERGTFPNDAERLRGVPGMGRYTVNAILSQAFDRRLPILEANSQRVLCRLFGRIEDPRRAPLRGWLWRAAEEVLPRQRVGPFNQALMELGALVCTPAAPNCGECPLRTKCHARRLGLQESIPYRPTAPQTVDVQESAVVLRQGPRVLLVQRPEGGRWARMWEFPHGELTNGETHEQAALRLLRTLTGFDGQLGRELTTIRHGVTRFAITLVCFEANALDGEFRSSFYQQARWLEPIELSAHPVSAPQRRLARLLSEPGRQQHLF
jgi:A/G-specific adenine glycosylase